jgi:signal transduction histidine kinase
LTTDDPRARAAQVLEAEQDERRRIALFLHDGPVQSLAGVALMLDAAIDLIGRGNVDQASEVLEKAMARTRATVGELRDLSFNLEPVVLRDHGFAMAVGALSEARGLEHGIRFEVDVALVDALGEREQAALYEIVREAVEGAIRRGPPKTCIVTATAGRPDALEVIVRDDAPSERRRRSIEVLEERARTLGGALSVTQDDDGTTMRLVLPR